MHQREYLCDRSFSWFWREVETWSGSENKRIFLCLWHIRLFKYSDWGVGLPRTNLRRLYIQLRLGERRLKLKSYLSICILFRTWYSGIRLDAIYRKRNMKDFNLIRQGRRSMQHQEILPNSKVSKEQAMVLASRFIWWIIVIWVMFYKFKSCVGN